MFELFSIEICGETLPATIQLYKPLFITSLNTSISFLNPIPDMDNELEFKPMLFLYEAKVQWYKLNLPP